MIAMKIWNLKKMWKLQNMKRIDYFKIYFATNKIYFSKFIIKMYIFLIDF